MADLSDIQKQLEQARPNLEKLRESLSPRMPEYRPLPIPVNPNLASEFYKRLTKWVADFDESLDQDHEVGVRLVNFGQTIMFYLTDIGYWNPSLITFQGQTDDGNPVELIQHVSQISIMLMKLPRQDPEKPKKPIGFASEHAE